MQSHHPHPRGHVHVNHSKDRFERADHPIRVLTYNIFMRPVIGDKTDLKNERAALIKDAILHYDIVLFQELFPEYNNRRKELIEHAHNCHFKYVSVPPAPGWRSKMQGSLISSGLLTLSKFPVVITEFIEYKAKAGVDGLATKGVLYSKIKFPNHHHAHVFNTHTQATYNVDYHPSNVSDHKQFMARLRQIQEYRDAVDLCLNNHSRLFKDGPSEFKDIVILAGDFNVNANGKPLPKDKFEDLPWVKGLKSDTFREYEYLIGVLSKNGLDNVVDLAFESLGNKHPVTFADAYEAEDGTPTPRETKLTSVSEHLSKQCLDYMFHLTPCADVKQNPAFTASAKDCRVNEFFVDNQTFTQLSDHYGIEWSFNVTPIGH